MTLEQLSQVAPTPAIIKYLHTFREENHKPSSTSRRNVRGPSLVRVAYRQSQVLRFLDSSNYVRQQLCLAQAKPQKAECMVNVHVRRGLAWCPVRCMLSQCHSGTGCASLASSSVMLIVCSCSLVSVRLSDAIR